MRVTLRQLAGRWENGATGALSWTGALNRTGALSPLGLTAVGMAVLPAVRDWLGRMGRGRLPVTTGWRGTPPAGAVTIGSAVALVLVGAGWMYLFDPVSGAQRRGVMREKMSELWGRGRDRLRSPRHRLPRPEPADGNAREEQAGQVATPFLK